ncbi:MAG TPA: hypothetical protein VHV51_12960 [Polyangiaceae bacterium]|nr:hypothetical protein [Polyangiaceae bacterium]
MFALTLPAYAGAPSRPAASNAPPPAASNKPTSDQNFAAEVLILHATNDKTGIDPRIGKLPELGQPPFSNYDSYKLLARTRLPLKSEPENLKLPNGRTLQVRLLEVPQKDSVRLSASINRPNGKEFLPLLEVKARVGQAFIVAGQSYKKGILVLVIRVAK